MCCTLNRSIPYAGCWPACSCFSWSWYHMEKYWILHWFKRSECFLGYLGSFYSLPYDDIDYVVILSLFMCREPDIPSWAPLLYQLQLLDFREKLDPLTLPVADRIRIGNQKRERGNFHFQREEYSMAARAYSMALDVLTTRSRGNPAATPECIHRNISILSPAP